jgi:hypothetical protein
MRDSWPVLDPRASRPSSRRERSESLREPKRAGDRLPVFEGNVERAASHAWAPLVSSGRAYRSDRTAGASRFEGVVVALVLTV